MDSNRQTKGSPMAFANTSQGLGIVNVDSASEGATTNNASATDWTSVSASRRREVQQTARHTPQSATTPLMTSLSGSTQCDEVFSAVDTSYKGVEQHLKKQASSVFSATNSCLASLHSISEKQLYNSNEPCHTPVHCVACGSPGSLQGRNCNGSARLKQSMWGWPGFGVILMSVLATSLSGLFFFVGATAPTYGNKVGTHGLLTVSSAAFLTSAIAKVIESLSAVLVAALVGQILARKAYASNKHRGVSLAQITMRGWATQPGTISSHWSSVRHAALSKLGLIALISAVTVLLYTSAATALVQPQLKFARPEYRMLQSQVYSSFANAYYVQKTCKSPITHLIDTPDEIGKSCIQIEHASQAYHNYQSWLAHWANVALIGNGTGSLYTRPHGSALLNDNTTITAPWIDKDTTNATKWLDKTGWMVNNVTMAMPHPGVVSAASDPSNDIMQPDQLDGLGVYSIQASVPVPFVNVLCVMGMSEGDLDPIMNDTAGDTTDGTGTVMDDIFLWGPKFGAQKWPPIFSRDFLPKEHNFIVNDTAEIPYGRDAIYVLGKGGDVDQAGVATEANYALCSLRVGQTPTCSTEYTASSRGGTLKAVCEDPSNDMIFSNVHVNDSLYGNDTLSKDWVNIGAEWARSVSLNDGIVNGNSSNVRVWTQLFLSNSSVNPATGEPSLDIALPSPAEALAVLSGCTLLQSAQDTPFVQFWNYSSPMLMDPGQTQYFNASIRAQQYASGGTAAYQKGFLVVLLTVFALNAFILLYLVCHRHWYLDFGDPINLFPLAANSPPSRQSVETSCESDGEDMLFKQYWKLRTTEGGHMYLEIPEERGNGAGSPISSTKSAIVRSMDVFERLRRD